MGTLRSLSYIKGSRQTLAIAMSKPKSYIEFRLRTTSPNPTKRKTKDSLATEQAFCELKKGNSGLLAKSITFVPKDIITISHHLACKIWPRDHQNRPKLKYRCASVNHHCSSHFPMVYVEAEPARDGKPKTWGSGPV